MSENIHVLPTNDLFDHQEEGIGCKCNPRLEWQPEGECFVVVHNSYDGREFHEPDSGKLPQ